MHKNYCQKISRPKINKYSKSFLKEFYEKKKLRIFFMFISMFIKDQVTWNVSGSIQLLMQNVDLNLKITKILLTMEKFLTNMF